MSGTLLGNSSGSILLMMRLPGRPDLPSNVGAVLKPKRSAKFALGRAGRGAKPFLQ
ncbi:hypothetical protein [Roseomonas haemaphysalidis]|uniref:Uncharacterized protein n=1 Tax=Roseomonas haemaphysalidis TaxID=2768162 RepID=A0ABS3KW36_9PROT|nr:hypothetical protein [Roseomonas haemaphysalidis]MBO1081702.1 hypothetical protein [Roseomonas haemaphysalidis]